MRNVAADADNEKAELAQMIIAEASASKTLFLIFIDSPIKPAARP
jgi:hypothetical protein